MSDELRVVSKKELIEVAKFQFGKGSGESTRLEMIATTFDSVVVSFYDRNGDVHTSYEYYGLDPDVAAGLYREVTQAESIGRKFNELFLQSKSSIYEGEQINLID